MNNYAFVTAIQRTGSHLSNMYADANVIFLLATVTSRGSPSCTSFTRAKSSAVMVKSDE